MRSCCCGRIGLCHCCPAAIVRSMPFDFSLFSRVFLDLEICKNSVLLFFIFLNKFLNKFVPFSLSFTCHRHFEKALHQLAVVVVHYLPFRSKCHHRCCSLLSPQCVRVWHSEMLAAGCGRDVWNRAVPKKKFKY